MSQGIKVPKKLIEVALPLDDINAAAAKEKSIRFGHPSTLHLWWARRPLAAARAVIFAQMVNDPGGERGYFSGKSKAQADREREELFDIIRDLVKWENTTNVRVLERAREAIRKSWRETCALNKGKPGFDPEKLPAFHDPFAGGGALPLEAQRLGLESYASDLNPVAVLINKAMIEIPPKFADHAPVGPLPPGEHQHRMHEDWSGAKGLAEDVRRYGAWMREEAFKRIGHLYPSVDLPKEHGGGKATVIAWLWARTVKSPNPAFSHVDVPLVSTFVLSSKDGKSAYIQPVVEGDCYRFEVRKGNPPESAKGGTTAGKRNAFLCLLSGVPIDYNYIRTEGKVGRIDHKLMAVVVEGPQGRVYLPPTPDIEALARSVEPEWRPNTRLPDNPRDFKTPNYGMDSFGDLFTPRQLIALTAFSDLVQHARAKVKVDAQAAGMKDDGKGLDQGGAAATAYSDAVAVYLGLGVSRMADINNTLCMWETSKTQVRHLFTKQAIPMLWDFAEPNVFSMSAGDFGVSLGTLSKVIERFVPSAIGQAVQADAQSQSISLGRIISTDPPYYDNIGYADLSDFFYVWLRRALRPIFPFLFATMAVPKAEELVATPYRHGSKEKAETFFLDGMTEAMHRLAEQAHQAFPTTIYYAFKQSDTTDAGTGSTGWETFLEAVLCAGFAITGTWPMRTELANRLIGSGKNALASSIVLVCRKREIEAQAITRREFQRELREQMPEALETMIGGTTGFSPIAPVDLAQAAIGPGMAIFSKYAAVLEADGSPMNVHNALLLINKEITDYLTPTAGHFDPDTVFCSAWFDQYGWASGQFGEADVLSRAKGTSVDGLKEAGVIEAGGGKVRLLKWQEYPAGWSPEKDNNTPVWEAAHYLIRALSQQGESEAGTLLARMPERAEPIRQLAYHLYTLCERKKWAEEARAYNELVTSWHAILAASHEAGHKGTQEGFDF